MISHGFNIADRFPKASLVIEEPPAPQFPQSLCHGHVSPAKTLARCGGPALCHTCQYEREWRAATNDEGRQVARLRWLIREMKTHFIRGSHLDRLAEQALEVQ